MPSNRTIIEDQALDWQIRLHTSPYNPALRLAHRRWLKADPEHRRSWQQVQQLWELTGALEVRSRALWPSRGRHAVWLSAAVVACLALGLFWLAVPGQHATGPLQLADGSTVWITPGTRLHTAFEAGQRQVILDSGNAFFDVTPDTNRPFRVSAGELNVLVTGTSFAVNLSDDQVSVAVASGQVQVSTASQRTTLSAGQQVSMASNNPQLSGPTTAIGLIAPWRDNLLAARDQSIADLVEQVRRYTPLPILIRDPELASLRVSGLYDLQSPRQALAEMVHPHGGSVREIWPGLLIIDRSKE